MGATPEIQEDIMYDYMTKKQQSYQRIPDGVCMVHFTGKLLRGNSMVWKEKTRNLWNLETLKFRKKSVNFLSLCYAYCAMRIVRDG